MIKRRDFHRNKISQILKNSNSLISADQQKVSFSQEEKIKNDSQNTILINNTNYLCTTGFYQNNIYVRNLITKNSQSLTKIKIDPQFDSHDHSYLQDSLRKYFNNYSNKLLSSENKPLKALFVLSLDSYQVYQNRLASIYQNMSSDLAKQLNQHFSEFQKVQLRILNKIQDLFSSVTIKDELEKKQTKINLNAQSININSKGELSNQFSNSNAFHIVLLENQKLAAEIAMLSQKLKEIEVNHDSTYYKEKCDQLTQNIAKIQMEHEELAYKKDQQIQMGKIIYENLTSQVKNMENQLKFLQESCSREMRKSTENLHLYQQSHQKEKSYFESLHMAREDIEYWMVRYNDQQETLKVLRKKIQTLQEKIDRVQKERTKQLEIPEKNQVQDNEMLESLKYINTQFVFTYNAYFQQGMQGQSPAIKSRRKSISVESDLQKYFLMRPTFYSLIQHRMEKYSNFQNYHQSSVNSIFFSTIRSILDSYYSTLQYHIQVMQNRNPPHFIDFTYEWFSNFDIEPITRRMQKRKTNPDDARVLFYIDLINPFLDNLHEIIAFREFLLEKISIEEIYFYLNCRNQLYGGLEMDNDGISFRVIHYVEHSKVKTFFSQFFRLHDQSVYSAIIANLKDKITKFGKYKYFIDGSFVLRICSEFFHIERFNRFRQITDYFNSLQYQIIESKLSFTFGQVFEFFSINFKNLSVSQITKIYRDSYSIGQGQVNLDSILTVINEFEIYLEVGSQEKIFGSSKTGGQIDNNSEILKKQNEILEKIQFCLYEYGINEVVNKHRELQSLCQQNLKNLSQLGFEQIINYLMTIRKSLNNFGEVMCLDRLKIFDNLQIQLIVNTISDSIQRECVFYNESITRHDKQQDLKYLEKVEKVQRFIKQKVAHWYKLLKKIFQTQLVNTQNQKK